MNNESAAKQQQEYNNLLNNLAVSKKGSYGEKNKIFYISYKGKSGIGMPEFVIRNVLIGGKIFNPETTDASGKTMKEGAGVNLYYTDETTDMLKAFIKKLDTKLTTLCKSGAKVALVDEDENCNIFSICREKHKNKETQDRYQPGIHKVLFPYDRKTKEIYNGKFTCQVYESVNGTLVRKDLSNKRIESINDIMPSGTKIVAAKIMVGQSKYSTMGISHGLQFKFIVYEKGSVEDSTDEVMEMFGGMKIEEEKVNEVDLKKEIDREQIDTSATIELGDKDDVDSDLSSDVEDNL